jgi:hypothetical protein
MKSEKLIIVLWIGLALMSNGCSSLIPPNAEYPTAEQEWRQEQLAKNTSDSNTGEPGFGWEILYDALCIGGQSLANK